MVGTRPLGYATPDQLATHLDLKFDEGDHDAACLLLRAAEDVITRHSGRMFLPVRATLKTTVDTDDTAW